MNSDPVYERLRELSWRRPLTAMEAAELRAWSVAHPEAQSEAGLETALTQVLAQLPDVPVPSNFTAQLWRTIEHDEMRKARARRRRPGGWWRLALPRLAVFIAVAGAGLLAYRHHESVQQVELVKSFLTVADPSLADPKVIEDFEVICQLTPAAAADEELLRLMQ